MIAKLTFLLLGLLMLASNAMPPGASNDSQAFNITIESSGSKSLERPRAVQPATSLITSRYYNTVSNKVVLDDGRVVKCSIPLVHEEEQVLLGNKRNLTTEEAQPLLNYLKDTCVRHRTKEFLWEFCYGKYLRQYDDFMTVQAAQKREFELFFLGFFNQSEATKWRQSITPQTGDFFPKREYFEKELRYQVQEEMYLRSYGKVVQWVDSVLPKLNRNETVYALQISIPASASVLNNDSLVVNVAGETMGMLKKKNQTHRVTKIINGQPHIQLDRLIHFTHGSSSVLLREEFPFDFITKKSMIYSYTNRTSRLKKIPRTHLYNDTEPMLSGNMLFTKIANLASLSTNNLGVFLVYNDSNIQHGFITSIFEDGKVFQLDSQMTRDDESVKLATSIVLSENQKAYFNNKWTYRSASVWMFGNVLVGETTRFKKEFQRGDRAMLTKIRVAGHSQIDFEEVVKVVNDKVLLFRKEDQPRAYWFPGYLIGKYANMTQELINARAQKRERIIYKDPELGHLNTELPRRVQFFSYNESAEETDLVCGQNQQFMDPESWMISFTINYGTGSLLFHFTQEECKPEGIELHFLKQKQIIVTNYGEKASFRTVPFPTHLLSQMAGLTKIWIIYHKGTLRVGLGSEISLENQILAFKTEKYSHLGYYAFNKKLSHDMELMNFKVSPPPVRSIKVLENLSEVPTYTEEVSYFETYTKGSFCGAAGRDRSVEVEYRCSKNHNKFLKIEEINERKICQYHLVVSSYLFCSKQANEAHKYGDIANQINCVV